MTHTYRIIDSVTICSSAAGLVLGTARQHSSCLIHFPKVTHMPLSGLIFWLFLKSSNFYREFIFIQLLVFFLQTHFFLSLCISIHVCAEILIHVRLDRHRSTFYIKPVTETWRSDHCHLKTKWSWGIFRLLFITVTMLPCFHILAKIRSGNDRRKGVFLTPLILSQNRSRKYRKFHRKAGQFSFIAGSYPNISFNIWIENRYESLKIKVHVQQNQSNTWMGAVIKLKFNYHYIKFSTYINSGMMLYLIKR